MINIDSFITDYSYLFYFLLVVFFLVMILFCIANLISKKQFDIEKASSYECGFEPFESNTNFNVQFYLVGVSFLIFDLELIFLYPWAIYFGFFNIFNFWIFLIFFFFLVLGFIYEWHSGALIWV